MSILARSLSCLAVVGCLSAVAPALGQHHGGAPGLPPGHSPNLSVPHGNDPHPPANQPAYQIPPNARPGVPRYPGAPYGNDPYFRRTEPRIEFPKNNPPNFSAPPPSVGAPSAPYAYTGKPRKERAMPPARNLQECVGRWSAKAAISKAEWEAACRRLEISGRVRTE